MSFFHDVVHVFEHIRIFVRCRPRLCPRTRVYFGPVYSPYPYLRKTSFCTRATSAMLTPGLRKSSAAWRASEKIAKASSCLALGSPIDECPADLRPVAVDLRSQFGGDGIAWLKLAFGGRFHADYFGAAGSDQHEVVFGAVGFEKRLYFGYQLVLGHPDFNGLREMLVAAVGELGGSGGCGRFRPRFLFGAVLRHRRWRKPGIQEPERSDAAIISMPAIATTPRLPS